MNERMQLKAIGKVNRNRKADILLTAKVTIEVEDILVHEQSGEVTLDRYNALWIGARFHSLDNLELTGYDNSGAVINTVVAESHAAFWKIFSGGKALLDVNGKEITVNHTKEMVEKPDEPVYISARFDAPIIISYCAGLLFPSLKESERANSNLAALARMEASIKSASNKVLAAKSSLDSWRAKGAKAKLSGRAGDMEKCLKLAATARDEHIAAVKALDTLKAQHVALLDSIAGCADENSAIDEFDKLLDSIAATATATATEN